MVALSCHCGETLSKCQHWFIISIEAGRLLGRRGLQMHCGTAADVHEQFSPLTEVKRSEQEKVSEYFSLNY